MTQFLSSNLEWLISGLGAAVAGVVANLLWVLLRRCFLAENRAAVIKEQMYPGSPADHIARRLKELAGRLHETMAEIDSAMRALGADITDREKALNALVEKHAALTKEEESLEKRVNALETTPLEVADYFRTIMEEHIKRYETRNSRRDMFMFLLGIVVTTVVSILVAIMMK